MRRSYTARILKPVTIFRRIISFAFKGSTVILICLMLIINAATLAISSFYNVASSLIETTTGIETPRKKNELKLSEAENRTKRLNTQLNSERTKNASLSRRVRGLKITEARLRAHGPDVKFRGKTQPMRAVVEEVTSSVSRRTTKVAAANVGSMAGEGIPFWGIAVIVGSTTLEIHAACETVKEMRELEQAFLSVSSSQEDVNEVCGARIPTASELWEKIKAAPASVWESAKSYFPDLPDPSFTGVWFWFVSQFSEP